MNTRMEEEKLYLGQIWEAELKCGCTIQLAERTKEEIRNNGIKCPIHSDKYEGLISPIFQGIVHLRKVRIGK